MDALPRQPISDDSKGILASIREIISFIKQIPRFEIKTIESAAQGDLVLKTSLRTVKGLLLIQAFYTRSPDTTVIFSALQDWRLVSGGIKVRVYTAPLMGVPTLTTFTFLIIGE